jgi:transposase
MKMRAEYKISNQEALKVRERMRFIKNVASYRRMEAVALLGEGKTPEEVASITQYHPKYVRNLGLEYHRKGIDAFSVDLRQGGNNRNMSFEEEEKLLEPFKKAALAGQVLEISSIKAAYEEATGKSLDTNRGQIYNVLHRHKWRKIKPRSQHPDKASEAEIEASKKLTIALQN